MRTCAIDIGSNSVRLLVADVSGKEIAPVMRSLEITRLGEGMGKSDVLSPEAASRTLAAVERYLSEAQKSGAERFILFGTSALREASNAREFLRAVKERTGMEIRVLSGEEEAALVYHGVTRAVPAHGEPPLVVDIGGGSAELIGMGADGRPRFASLPLGCVRLTERFLSSDPPSSGELAALAEHVAKALSTGIRPRPGAHRLIGAGGTITTAATLALGLAHYDPRVIHGCAVSRAQIEGLLRRLSGMSLAARKSVAGLEEKRADIIIGGLVTLAGIMDFFGRNALTVSDEGILHASLLKTF